ncbi:hypothetical protein COCNU_scaffold000134G000050 [Cocos nucifera]|nr:hypothetical protein [Cocos nucifera]
MKKHLADFKSTKEKAKQKRAEVDRRAAKPSSYHSRESEQTSAPDDEAQMEAAIRVSMNDQYCMEEMVRYRERFGSSYYESESSSAAVEREFEFRRTTSVRKTASRGRYSISSMLKVFGSRRRSSKDIPIGATIHDLDPHIFFGKDSKQQRIDGILKKNKKKGTW